ncbi:MAG TPA: anti-sigma factor antagonist [Solirubrobacteraceae bacterium]
MASPVDVVRALWDAHAAGGIDAMLAAADDGVVWQPHIAHGHVFRGTAELREALDALAAEGIVYEAELHDLEQHGDVVLASGTLRVHRNGTSEESRVHWAYHFREGRLWRQSTYASREDALDALVALRAVAVPLAVDEEPERGGEHVVRIEGELDIATAPKLEAVLLRKRPRDERVILDLADLRFMDSTGLRILLRATAAAKEGRWELYLRNVPDNVRRLFTLSGVLEAVPPDAPPDAPPAAGD